MPRLFASLAIFGSALLATTAATTTAAATTVATAAGRVEGRVAGHVTQYLGIPYAAPPVGAQRWAPPVPPKPWAGTRAATRYGPACPQSLTLGVFAAKSASEDCLTLNVFTPAREAEKLPVMVWIHGGGLFDGASTPYDPAALVARGAVVVTINYRLNVFGFLPLASDDGNYGLMDQQLALRWVKQNIGAFGGDAQKVTIFGESAGGESVLAHLMAPASAGLFERAIVESGTGLMTVPRAVAEKRGQAFAGAVGCPEGSGQMACLRALPVTEIMEKAPQFMGAPLVVSGGETLPLPLMEALASGHFNHVPVINGANRDEWRWLTALAEGEAGKPLTAATYLPALRDGYGIGFGFGAAAPAIAATYPLAAHGRSASLAYSAALTDAVFVCPALRVNAALSKQGVPVYAYQFADRAAPLYGPSASFPLGAYHTAEILYLFPGFHGASGTPASLSPAQEKLATHMQESWVAFARDGAPPAGWPAFADGKYLSLKTPAPKVGKVENLRLQHHCGFWENLQP